MHGMSWEAVKHGKKAIASMGGLKLPASEKHPPA